MGGNVLLSIASLPLDLNCLPSTRQSTKKCNSNNYNHGHANIAATTIVTTAAIVAANAAGYSRSIAGVTG